MFYYIMYIIRITVQIKYTRQLVKVAGIRKIL